MHTEPRKKCHVASTTNSNVSFYKRKYQRQKRMHKKKLQTRTHADQKRPQEQTKSNNNNLCAKKKRNRIWAKYFAR